MSDAFLLEVAEISATLIGLFLVGAFFFVERSLRRPSTERNPVDAYMRSGTRITLIVFTIPVFVPLALVALDPVWSRLLFATLSVVLLAANVDSARRVRGVSRTTGSLGLFLNEVVATGLTVTLVVLPWVLGGFHPTREDLTWAILLALLAGFLSIAATVVAAFDVAGGEEMGATQPSIDP